MALDGVGRLRPGSVGAAFPNLRTSARDMREVGQRTGAEAPTTLRKAACDSDAVRGVPRGMPGSSPVMPGFLIPLPGIFDILFEMTIRVKRCGPGKLRAVLGRTYRSKSVEETGQVARELARGLRAGDAVLLTGPLGAGKTTFVRAVLAELGHTGPVRSPTFNLTQTFDTEPPVMHADLYRVESAEGLGIEDYLSSHVCLIEWAEKAEGLVGSARAIRVEIQPDGEEREIRVFVQN